MAHCAYAPMSLRFLTSATSHVHGWRINARGAAIEIKMDHLRQRPCPLQHTEASAVPFKAPRALDSHFHSKLTARTRSLWLARMQMHTHNHLFFRHWFDMRVAVCGDPTLCFSTEMHALFGSRWAKTRLIGCSSDSIRNIENQIMIDCERIELQVQMLNSCRGYSKL